MEFSQSCSLSLFTFNEPPFRNRTVLIDITIKKHLGNIKIHTSGARWRHLQFTSCWEKLQTYITDVSGPTRLSEDVHKEGLNKGVRSRAKSTGLSVVLEHSFSNSVTADFFSSFSNHACRLSFPLFSNQPTLFLRLKSACFHLKNPQTITCLHLRSPLVSSSDYKMYRKSS